jgi:hypothetical protein
MQAMVESVVNPQVMAGGEEAGAPEGGEKEAPASQGKEE